MALLLIGLLGLAFGATIGSLFGARQSSENIANETVQALINVSNSASQSCQISADQIQSINISGNTGGTFNVNQDWTQYLVLQSTCSQNVTFQNDISQLMAQEADQIAKTISQQFQLGSAASKNVSNQTANLSIQVSNAFVQNCTGYESQIQVATLTNNTNTDVNLYQNWEQYNASTFECVMNDRAVNNTTQQLQQTVNQQAETTVQNFFAVIFGAIFGIFAIIGIIIFGLIFLGRIGRSSTPVTVQQSSASNVDLSDIDPDTLSVLLNTPSNPTAITSTPITSIPITTPITSAPITRAPITSVPTTRAPTTRAPTTRVPTTSAPTTSAPITSAPTAPAPTSRAPSTSTVTTRAPSTSTASTPTASNRSPTSRRASSRSPTRTASTRSPTRRASSRR